MKIQWLLLPFILLGACKTPAGTKENENMAKATATSTEKLLRKTVGGLSKESERNQFYECFVTSGDIKNSDEIKKLIASVPRGTGIKMGEAFHIVAQVPSIEIYAYDKGEEILIYKDYDKIVYPVIAGTQTIHGAAQDLQKLANKLCPGPKGKEG